MESSFRPSVDEINNFGAASLVVAAAFVAYRGSLTLSDSLFYLAVGALILLTRELGQRTIARWQEAYVDFKVSLEGVFLTILGAAVAVITDLSFLLLFPVFNEFSGRSYEHWGKTIDAVWMKRQYWMISGGVLALFGGWLFASSLGFPRIAEAFIIFTLFQLLPFDYSNIPTGTLDGAYILRWSGFVWLTMFGFALLATAVTV